MSISEDNVCAMNALYCIPNEYMSIQLILGRSHLFYFILLFIYHMVGLRKLRIITMKKHQHLHEHIVIILIIYLEIIQHSIKMIPPLSISLKHPPFALYMTLVPFLWK